MTIPKLLSLNSLTLASAGYEYGDLYIRIRGGEGIYIYYEVPESVYKDLISASSPDEYFEHNIKNIYKQEKLC